MKKLKIHKSAGFVLAMTGSLCIGGTAAYLSDFEQQRNVMAVGRNQTEIQEDFPAPSVFPEEATPEYKKTVWVKNSSSAEPEFDVDCYVRVSLSYSNYDIAKAVTLLGLDTVNWKYNSEDGYYYYQKLLKQGEVTLPLFTGVRIDRNQMDTLYQDTIHDFQIQVYEESVAAQEFADCESAWQYYLNPLLTV